jgi:hypothetical protein
LVPVCAGSFLPRVRDEREDHTEQYRREDEDAIEDIGPGPHTVLQFKEFVQERERKRVDFIGGAIAL